MREECCAESMEDCDPSFTKSLGLHSIHLYRLWRIITVFRFPGSPGDPERRIANCHVGWITIFNMR